ncbi:hypothetical protein AB0D04_29780 [Streptomyces sp. NPDC048483]|uniref:hypothetical protein n=1 Tax=Streptomyces sp. NPDC048483 TaxID=3154927 RepID=UPI003444114A
MPAHAGTHLGRGLGWRTPQTADPLRWRILGLYEPDVAARVDIILAACPGDTSVGYCWTYPYVDIALHADPDQHTALTAEITQALDGHIVSTGHTGALQQLKALVPRPQLVLHDGLSLRQFAQALALPAPSGPRQDQDLTIRAAGQWRGGSPHEHSGLVTMRCGIITAQDTSHSYEMEQPNRGSEILDCAAEFIAWSTLRAFAASARG